jgi:very-short-patch-repair endonuclease
MMSPMSIATFLPPGALQFDLVIFDEASQVKPVDAFGAILRGEQAVVVGDSQQLPPTNFFDSLSDDSDEEEKDGSVGDMESILSLFAGKGSPERMLRWHYRSQDESLIAISNAEFYHSRLVIFPNPGSNPHARGLRFHHLPQTAYDRGKTRTNLQEARAVAEAIMDHARTLPDLSLGVVAFSMAQRDTIEMQLELLRRQDPTCEEFFSEALREPFFVKNLENVQGDERDVIFISIGYGKTAEGYFPMSFGPLNRDGGERRLNVLISRARLAMDVFANFTADDIDLSRAGGPGVVALRKFLAYAQHRRLDIPHSTGREPDSPFEESVIQALQAHGVEVEPQVGTAGFFIDIGVKDPAYPGRYLLGIECDGATYHSARSARDRDRLRQEVLENRGWRLHRIWSTNWYQNPKEEIEKALAAIEQAKTLTPSSFPKLPGNKANGGLPEPIIERSKAVSHTAEWQAPSKFYERTQVTIPLNNRALHEIPVPELMTFVQSVVHVESPVHPLTIIQRITEGAGLKRAGSRIQDVVSRAIQQAVKGGFICQRGEFLWGKEMERPSVRDRSLLDPTERKLEFIAPEELEESLLEEVGESFSLVPDEAIQNAAKRLGISRVTDQTKQLMTQVIDQLVDAGHLNIHDTRVCLK